MVERVVATPEALALIAQLQAEQRGQLLPAHRPHHRAV